MSRHLVMPVAGLSSRFHGGLPKWLRLHPSGRRMLTQGLISVAGNQIFDSIIIIYRTLGEHSPEFICPGWQSPLRMEISKIVTKLTEIRFVGISRSNSQPETVYRGIQEISDEDEFLVKDCDGYYELPEYQGGNVVCYSRLEDHPEVSAASKSYVNVLQEGIIDNIVEKKVLGSTFCVGGYGFRSKQMFNNAYDTVPPELFSVGGFYLSHLIYHAMHHGEQFRGIEVDNYQDWGTQADWDRLFQ